MRPHLEPFPFDDVAELVRRLRGILVAYEASGATVRVMRPVQAIRSELERAMRLARVSVPGAVYHSVAWRRTEGALAALPKLRNLDGPTRTALLELADRVLASGAGR